ncbi:MAG: aminotransferase class I/II-fold pyridoxal phosphate-dependent enzyme [Fusobacteriaceae bacterium]|nr:aminotransferase class I/II-fold pyridoxal phosphate-dependent enzyme [Fusobacteriaceae bacterium]MBP9510623.1 aminotransferase class I/II-fold pyridoxal phosphate-dependent enzyme [Fusobacteriaceae bacterium]
MLEINPRLNNIEVSVIRKISEASSKYKNMTDGKKLINLTIGEPDIEQPKIIVEETKKYMDEDRICYSQLGGVLSLREEIAKSYKSKYNVECTPDEIIITVGTTEGIATTVRTIIQEGDEVIIPLPAYPGYEPLITLAGAKVIKVDTSKDNYELTVDSLKSYVTSKTRAIIVNYPSNPSGVIISKKNRDEILKFAKENDIYIISDEVYSEILFESEYNSFLMDGYRENVIVLNGFSKSHSMTGWRVGYIVASKELRKQLLKVHQYSVTSTSIISQMAGVVALTKCQDLKEKVEIYKERAEKVYNRFKLAGINPIKPQGAFYIFIPLLDVGVKDSYKFALELLEEERVAIVPGVAFSMDGYIRISLIESIDILLEASERIIEFIKKHYMK